MTPEQAAKLQEIAKGVTGNLKNLNLTDTLNRIHFITNRNYAKCIEGLRMMIWEGLIKPEFITDLHRLDAFAKVIDKAMPLFEATNSELTKIEEHVSDGPKDDEDESEEAGDGPIDMGIQVPRENPILTRDLNLSHINANF
jgi:hypothetical protein